MNPDERIIGFDARKLGLDFTSYWDSVRRSTYLFREDVHSLRSTDHMVWPSVLNSDRSIGVQLRPEEEVALSGIDHPDSWIGLNEPCWSNLNELKAYLGQHSKRIYKPYALVGITCVAPKELHDWKSSFPYTDTVEPNQVESDWQFLGYDISDAMLSGLSNCGFLDPNEMKESRKEWSSHINDYHLFDNLELAEKFREYTNARVPEHSPFFIYGLYVICEIRV